MRARSGIITGVAALALLAGCSDDDGLMNLRSTGEGPDEFAILPPKALQAPEDFAALPAPTPGGANRADPTPAADAVAALGGDGTRVVGGGVRDSALVGHATRFGTDPGIRRELAQADAEFRSRRNGRLLERVFDVNVYYDAYGPQALDQYRELDRFRAAGVRTPAAPPEGLEEQQD
ncbi:DUF3035 domain-containing protein [Mesobaculum littorinae]|uniref:DUF3035 domain-containing protein n=1 Tax=Mesobaculum littorinae TaxID=2486419 RepID=A0A438AGF4_9RHOB|nr:DUF3035 domain-containing protein [Mesobaculum littorinae]RVV97786.1 DUF3035 domain-containing protein [Mesobaculum littorinae]